MDRDAIMGLMEQMVAQLFSQVGGLVTCWVRGKFGARR